MEGTTEPARLLIRDEGRFTRVSFPRQKIDGVAVRELYELAMALTDAPHPKLLIDLDGVSMVTSGAIGIFLAIRKKYLQHGGQMHIATADPLILQTLQVMNLHRILPIYDDATQATAAFR